jgi:hypothetical protein
MGSLLTDFIGQSMEQSIEQLFLLLTGALIPDLYGGPWDTDYAHRLKFLLWEPTKP